MCVLALAGSLVCLRRCGPDLEGKKRGHRALVVCTVQVLRCTVQVLSRVSSQILSPKRD